MINQQMLDYIKQQMQQGVDQEQIKNSLMANGWQLQDIEEGFNKIVATPNLYSTVPVAASSGVWRIIAGVIIGVAVLGGGAYLASQTIFKSKEVPKISNEVSNQPSAETPTNTTAPQHSQQSATQPQSQYSENKNCDNYQCLITAATQCQPITATISYSNLPFPLNPDMLTAGKTQYEIKKSSGTNDCTLIFSSPETIFSISEKGRQAALAQGMTDAQIIAQLQTMNSSVNSEVATKSQTTCLSNANAIVSYLTDMQTGTQNIQSNGQTATYTTSAGQKLICTITLPAGQPANTSVTITDANCSAKNGKATAVTNSGTACYNDQTDLGTIVGSLKINGKYPQCCVSK